jgi:hypothetical protein
MNATLLIVILLVIFALVGVSLLNEKRKQHSAQSPTASANQRRMDSYTQARYYNHQHKNPWIVKPQDSDSGKSKTE